MAETTVDLSPKYKSPPPKPPRRRYSDQLPNLSATLPSGKKKCDKDEKGSRNSISSCDNSGYESLPADWTSNMSPDTANFYLTNNLGSNSIDKDSNSCENFSNSSTTDLHTSLKDFRKIIDSKIPLQINENDTVLYPSQNNQLEEKSKCCQNYIYEHRDTVLDNLNAKYSENDTNSETLLNILLSDAKEHSKRHHSDPMLSYIDKSDISNKSAFRSNSFLGCSTMESEKLYANSFSTFSGNKEVQCLYEELHAAKEINDKLWNFVCSLQEKIENQDEKSESVKDLSISSILLSVYQAQKVKESAMEDRMNIILEERDSAIQELEEMMQIVASGFQGKDSSEENPCKGISDLLKELEVTYDPVKLLQQQRLLLSYLHQFKELKEDSSSNKLKLVIKERDELLEKLRHLEEESKNTNFSTRVRSYDSENWENNLLKMLCQVIHQRDVALSSNTESKKLENERLQIASEFTENNTCCEMNDSIMMTKASKSLDDQKPLLNSSESINALKNEVIILNNALHMEIEKRKHAEANYFRAERLVSVLQKKVHGQNVGMPV